MTAKEARQELERPLVFGDPKQIKAVRFIEQVNELHDKAKAAGIERDDLVCPECFGEGWRECPTCGNEDECEKCDGSGTFGTALVGFDGLSRTYDADVREAVIKLLMKNK